MRLLTQIRSKRRELTVKERQKLERQIYPNILFQLPMLLYGDPTSLALERIIQQMRYDDALFMDTDRWCLEYVLLAHGFPHYRLYYGSALVGIQDVRGPLALPRIRRNLAAYLAGLGYTPENAQLLVCGARTSLKAGKWASPRLFVKLLI